MRRAHALGHRAPRAVQALPAGSRGSAGGFGGALHVGHADHAIGSAAGDALELAAQLVRQAPRGRRRAQVLDGFGVPCAGVAAAGAVRARQLADHRAGVGLRRRGEGHQHRTDRDAIAFRRAERGDVSAVRRRDLDHGLVGFDRDQRLVGDDVVARRHVPLHDLGVAQALAEIGQPEFGVAHVYRMTSRAAARMRSREGM